MREMGAAVGRRDWDGLQSRWVLPAARRLYMIGALLALLVSAGALIVAFGFQLGTLGSASKEPMPAPANVSVKDISVADLDSLFAGPQRLRAEAQPVTLPIGTGETIATLAADSIYGIDSFEVIGGASAELIDQDDGSPTNGADQMMVRRVGGILIKATPELAKRLAARSDKATLPTMSLRVIAKDANGNRSAPADVSFRLSEAQVPSPRPATAGDGDERVDIAGPEALKGIAGALASIAAARGTPEWFDAYDRAIKEPDRCGAPGEAAFNRQYIAAFDHVRPKLTVSNLQTFYRGLCTAWRESQDQAASAVHTSDAVRAQVVARNLAAEAQAAMRRSVARIGRDAALGVAGSAVFFFMIVALFLAFMAIEGHSHAIRQALQTIARQDGAPGHG